MTVYLLVLMVWGGSSEPGCLIYGNNGATRGGAQERARGGEDQFGSCPPLATPCSLLVGDQQINNSIST